MYINIYIIHYTFLLFFSTDNLNLKFVRSTKVYVTVCIRITQREGKKNTKEWNDFIYGTIKKKCVFSFCFSVSLKK